MLEGQRILVTGPTGQVARPLTEKLNEKNEVWAAARFSDPQAKAELEAAGIKTCPSSLSQTQVRQPFEFLASSDGAARRPSESRPRPPFLRLRSRSPLHR